MRKPLYPQKHTGLACDEPGTSQWQARGLAALAAWSCILGFGVMGPWIQRPGSGVRGLRRVQGFKLWRLGMVMNRLKHLETVNYKGLYIGRKADPHGRPLWCGVGFSGLILPCTAGTRPPEGV